MSFLSFVNRVKAFSMVLVSVFWSTIKKLRCECGGSVTWPIPARRRPVTELFNCKGENLGGRLQAWSSNCQLGTTEEYPYSSSPMTARNCRSCTRSMMAICLGMIYQPTLYVDGGAAIGRQKWVEGVCRPKRSRTKSHNQEPRKNT